MDETLSSTDFVSSFCSTIGSSSSSKPTKSRATRKCPKRSTTGEILKERKHPMYRGVRMREWGRFVSEIRQPRKKSRIWLGTFATPEEAARAHDVAAFKIKGHSAHLNFPELAHLLPRPASDSTKDIQAAAAKAAAFNHLQTADSDTVASKDHEHDVQESSRYVVNNNDEAIFSDLPDLFIDQCYENGEFSGLSQWRQLMTKADQPVEIEFLHDYELLLWDFSNRN